MRQPLFHLRDMKFSPNFVTSRRIGCSVMNVDESVKKEA